MLAVDALASGIGVYAFYFGGRSPIGQATLLIMGERSEETPEVMVEWEFEVQISLVDYLLGW